MWLIPPIFDGCVIKAQAVEDGEGRRGPRGPLCTFYSVLFKTMPLIQNLSRYSSGCWWTCIFQQMRSQGLHHQGDCPMFVAASAYLEERLGTSNEIIQPRAQCIRLSEKLGQCHSQELVVNPWGTQETGMSRTQHYDRGQIVDTIVEGTGISIGRAPNLS